MLSIKAMKTKWIILVVCLAAAVAFLFCTREPGMEPVPSPEHSQVTMTEEVHSLEQNTPEPKSIVKALPSAAVSEDPVSVQVPVQPLEGRGDAMLTEIDMLGGVPFDQSITMPFD